MAVDGPIAAEDEGGGKLFSGFKPVQDFYVNAAASEAIDDFSRHVWVKKGSCDHLDLETFGVGFCGTGTLACAVFCNQTHLYWPGLLANPALIGLAMMYSSLS